MHDIICPNCGELFLGYDVAFDMSDYVLSLLYENTKDEEAVRQVKFKYYVDEEAILNSNPGENKEIIRCSNPGGPNPSDPAFSFHVTGSVLYDYIYSKSDFKHKAELDTVLEQLLPAVNGNDYSKISPLNLSQISSLYHILFGVSDKLIGEISIDDEYVRTAIKILVHLYENRHSQIGVDYKVAIYSSNNNGIPGYNVPDILFVKTGAVYKRISKCCRFCGKELPGEFGYYKMKPVVLLGSHSSGKTSYLLGLLNTVLSRPPFITSDPIKTATLSNDFNLKAFMKNIERFRAGLAPEKTDFENVPILNIKVKDTIYSFIDWPGEKFISGAGTDDDYVYKSRRVITRARHILFFMPPEQIDETLPAKEEGVRFDIMDLSASLSWHLSFPEKKRFASVIFIANKVDEHRGRINSDGLFNQINGKQEIHIFNGQAWQETEYIGIDASTKNFIMQKHPALFGALNNLSMGGAHYEKYYIPVAPYGHDAPKEKTEGENAAVIMRGFLSGLPFLRILKTDHIIK